MVASNDNFHLTISCTHCTVHRKEGRINFEGGHLSDIQILDLLLFIFIICYMFYVLQMTRAVQEIWRELGK